MSVPEMRYDRLKKHLALADYHINRVLRERSFELCLSLS